RPGRGPLGPRLATLARHWPGGPSGGWRRRALWRPWRTSRLVRRAIVNGRGTRQRDDSVCHRVVSIRRGEVDDLEVVREVAEQVQRPHRPVVVERDERIVED